jgi:hypothetical protein
MINLVLKEFLFLLNNFSKYYNNSLNFLISFYFNLDFYVNFILNIYKLKTYLLE